MGEPWVCLSSCLAAKLPGCLAVCKAASKACLAGWEAYLAVWRAAWTMVWKACLACLLKACLACLEGLSSWLEGWCWLGGRLAV